MQKKIAVDENTNAVKWEQFQAYSSIFILMLVAACAGFLFRSLITPGMDFHNELWAPTHLLVRGESPYDTASLNPNLPAAWFPMAIGFFFPLGWLSETSALQVWFAFGILALCALILLAQPGRPTIVNTLALALFCFFFPPVLNHFFLGQITITVTLCLVLAAVFAMRGNDWWTAFFVSMAFSKPHLAILAAFALCLHYYRIGRFKSVFLFAFRVLVMSLVLCLPLFIAYPNWIPDALEAMIQNPIWLYPSLFVVYKRNFPGWEFILWGLTLLLVLWVGWTLSKRKPLKETVYWALALAPLASPYVGSWDFVIILPLFFLTFANADWKRQLFLAFVYLLVWAGMAFVQVQANSDNHFFWWVPLLVVAAIASVTNWKADKITSP
ncbi:MAG: DUF2029 domain-containing protein [Anaerolineaceae bacterium]|nr:MAG: DUF2029 domain-containing protein [Anaerolineaceae bacterium]